MQQIANTEQADIWNGPDGAHWAEHHDRYDAMSQGADEPLLDAAAVTGTSRVLDIGCGTGRTTRRAALRARDGAAVGIDLSGPMLDKARSLALREGVGNASFIRGDAQVHPFPAAGFDAAISLAGVMFFADPAAAFANIRAALAPGGRAAFLTHRSAGARFQAVYAALAEHIPPPEDPGHAPGVTAFADPDRVLDLLTRTGFERAAAEPVEMACTLGATPEEAADFLFSGSLAPMVRHADPDGLRRARSSVLRALRASVQGGAVRMTAEAWLYTAVNPGGRPGAGGAPGAQPGSAAQPPQTPESSKE
ncbi:methyltransferase domain-containing protein [Nocardiopsis sp. CNT-189]|uniref:class I SAM-dependent methyltransferase n=1 Tax=Nocardiopsis oceanisediminis TaxID=2816862 RepID=UPI003B34BBA3